MTWPIERTLSVRSTKRVKEQHDDEEQAFSACLTDTEQIRRLQLPERGTPNFSEKALVVPKILSGCFSMLQMG